jgi:hypothetical protein
LARKSPNASAVNSDSLIMFATSSLGSISEPRQGIAAKSAFTRAIIFRLCINVT